MATVGCRCVLCAVSDMRQVHPSAGGLDARMWYVLYKTAAKGDLWLRVGRSIAGVLCGGCSSELEREGLCGAS